MPNKRTDNDTEDVDNDELEDEELEDDDEFDGDETIVMSNDDDDDDDDELDVSMEVNVEKLMQEMEKTASDDVARKKEIRRRLEEIQEERSLEDTYSFDLYGED